MEQFNTIPTSGNWADIAGILDANFLRCWTALVQSESLIGLDGSNFKGIFTSADALPEMTEPGWALVGTSLSALKLYVYNEGSTDWALLNDTTYNFTNFTEFQTQLDNLSSQVATICLKLGDLTQLHTTAKTSAVAAINEVKGNVNSAMQGLSNLDGKFQTLSLGIDQDDGLLYIYVNGVKTGDGVDVSGGSSGTRYTITYNLSSHLSSSSSLRSILEGRPYNTIITSDSPNYQIDSASVTMGGTDVTSSVYSDGTITIPSVSGNIVITVTAVFYAQLVFSSTSVNAPYGGTTQVGVKLDGQPTGNQNVKINVSGDATISANSLTFTPSNYNDYQYVTITNGNTTTSTETAIVTFRNSDKLMTESIVTATLRGLSYDDVVDTTIPTEGMHTLTAEDFASTSNNGDYVRLYTYTGEYTNLYVPERINGKIPWIVCDTGNVSFAGNTAIQYVTFADGVIYRGAGVTSGCSAVSLFKGCTSLIGVSNMNPAVTSLKAAFADCPAFKFCDNLEQLTNCKNLQQTFRGCTSLEYLQDLSGMSGVTMDQMCRDCSSLVAVIGMPSTVNAAGTNAFNGCTHLQSADVPAGLTNMTYMYSNCTALRKVNIYAEAVTTTSNAFNNCTNLKVYCIAESTTYTSMMTAYGSSSSVTILTFGSDSQQIIVVWGDSTSSPNRTWYEWPRRLMDRLNTQGMALKNQAVSGEWTTSTSARQGGNAVSVGAFTMPADTTRTQVTLTSEDGQTFGSSPVWSGGGNYNPCTIASVDGNLTTSSGVTYFTRSENGASASVAADTTVVSKMDSTFNSPNAIMLINLGCNAGWQQTPSVLVNQLNLMVQHFLAGGGTKYIVSSLYSGQFMDRESDIEIVEQMETLAATTFGEHWLNLRTYLIQNGLSDNNLTANETDTARMAIGQIAGQLLGGGSTTEILIYPTTSDDRTHPNAYGHNSISKAFYEKGVALGYWT